jgi:hypothetical protein
MNKDFDNQSGVEVKFLTLKQIGDEINLRNQKAIRKWLIDRGITIHKLSSKTYVYKIDFDLHSDKPLVINLRRNNPRNWKEMYRVIANNDILYNLMMLEMEQETVASPSTMVSTKTKNDEKLLMALVA